MRAGDVGLCFQRPESQLFCDTVEQDVAYGPRNLGLSEGDARSRVESALEQVGVSRELWGRHPLALSGGQRRLAAIAGVVAMASDVVLLDEPTAGLDADARVRVHGIARSLAAEGRAVCVVSHDVAEWLCEADDVALMRGGCVAWVGAAADIVREPDVLLGVGLEVPCALSLARVCADEAQGGDV